MKRQKKKDPFLKIEAKTEKAVFRPKMLERRRWALPLTVALITFLVYLPALKNGFVNWDDGSYVYENYAIRTLDVAFFKWAFTNQVVGHWHPLTMFSYALNYAVWGLEPWGYHLTNNLFHALNTLLVFLLTVKVVNQNSSDEGRQKKALITGGVTALLFGIHPMHVESVAWVSERKDVLSAFFYLLSLLAYLSYASAINTRKSFYYAICLFLFVMALMSKPMAVSLPVILLILDFYPLGRLTINIKTMLLEKVPFFLLSLLASFTTIWAHYLAGSEGIIELSSLMMRICIAMRAYIFYLLKLILPTDLAPLYPRPLKIYYLGIDYLGSFLLLAVITYLCVHLFKRNKLFLGIWMYYIVTLIPVIGIIQIGRHAAADRYVYLPSIGPFLLVGLTVSYLYQRYSQKQYRTAIVGGALIIFGILALMTVQQIAVWRNSITLWSHEITLFPSALSYSNRAGAYDKLGNHLKAIADFNTAIEIDPQYTEAYNNRGLVYNAVGDYQKAIKDYNKALEIDPQYVLAYNNRGLAYDSLGDFELAMKDYKAAIELDPGNAKAYYNRGNSYFKTGNYQSAIQDYNKIVELDPQYLMAYYNLGTAYNGIGNYKQAIKAFTKAIKLEPDDTRAYTNRGSAYSNLGDYKTAVLDFSMAVKIDPINTSAYYNLGVAYSQIGDAENSIANYKKAAALGLKEAQDYLRSEGVR